MAALPWVVGVVVLLALADACAVVMARACTDAYHAFMRKLPLNGGNGMKAEECFILPAPEPTWRQAGQVVRGDGFALGAAFLRGAAGAGGGFPCADVAARPGRFPCQIRGMFGRGRMRDERGMRERRLRSEFRQKLRLRKRIHREEDDDSGERDVAIRDKGHAYASQFLTAHERGPKSRQPRSARADQCRSACAARPARAILPTQPASESRPSPAVATAARRAPPRVAAKPSSPGRNPIQRNPAKCRAAEWIPGKWSPPRCVSWSVSQWRAGAECQPRRSCHARPSGKPEHTIQPRSAFICGSACRARGKVMAGFGAIRREPPPRGAAF